MRYAGAYRVGVANPVKASEYAQVSVMSRQAYYPWFMMIDKKGVIRAQAFGGDHLFDNELRDIKALALKLLAEPGGAAPVKSAPAKPTAQKK